MSTNYYKSNGVTVVPNSGIVVMYGGSATNFNTPGWLLCDGTAYSRTTYASLFSAIGTKYGSGDGSTTFNVPNLKDNLVRGAHVANSATLISSGNTSIQLTVDNIPSHSHNGGNSEDADWSHSHGLSGLQVQSDSLFNVTVIADWGFWGNDNGNTGSNTGGSHAHNYNLSAAGNSSAIPITPSCVNVNYIIKT
jgi:microcystin-dependent protein